MAKSNLIMLMENTTIKKISDTRLEITRIKEEKQEIEKATLEAEKESLQGRIAEINSLLEMF